MYRTKTQSISLGSLRCALFVAANLALPHLFHLVPGGGIAFLPIYWFTLVGVMRYGVLTGIYAAVMSPLLGYLIFGAPASVMLPDMLLKGILLCVAAALTVRLWGIRIHSAVLAVVAAWAVAGLVEWPFTGAAYAFQNFVTGIPGLVLMSIVAPLIAKRL